MAENKAPPQIFDESLLAVRRRRAAVRQAKHGMSFLILRAVEDLVDRILDVNRRFENVLIHGQPGLGALIRERLPEEKRPQKIVYIEDAADIPEGGDFDLVISLLRLQSENNMPGTLIDFHQALKPDGLFIGALFGGDTLQSLRQALYAADDKVHGGMTARVFPMITHTQAGQLLSHAGLNQPVIDIDRVTVNYSKLETLISDLRDLGETNVLAARSKQSLGQVYLNTLKKQTGALTCNYEILWMTGWAPHESQQKPLKPGSAKMRLADALNRTN